MMEQLLMHRRWDEVFPEITNIRLDAPCSPEQCKVEKDTVVP